jgi:hypothetical protein
MRLEIVGGAHTDAAGHATPNRPLVIVDYYGIHIDMATIPLGELWDLETTAHVT